MSDSSEEKVNLLLKGNGDVKLIYERPSYKTEALLNVVDDNGQPLKLSVETATDWPIVIATLVIGIGSILTSVMVAWDKLRKPTQSNKIKHCDVQTKMARRTT